MKQGGLKKHFKITKYSIAKNFFTVYHECQNRLSLELEYDGVPESCINGLL